MKIAHLISVFLPDIGGAQICVHNIAQRHAQKGDQVTLCFPFRYRTWKSTSYRIRLLWPGTVFLCQKVGFLGRLYLHFQLGRLQRKERFDLWQVTVGYPLGTNAVSFFKRHKIPCILRCSGDDIQKLPSVGYGMRLNEQVDEQVIRYYRDFDSVVAISKTVDLELKQIGVLKERIVQIPNGVDYLRFQRSAPIQELRRRWQIPEKATLLLTVGRNHPKKGFDLIPGILEELIARKLDVYWILYGSEAKTMTNYFTSDEPRRRFRGIGPAHKGQGDEETFPTEELRQVYKASDIFVFPTLIETFGIVLLEAMAAGLPAVITQAPGADELVQEGITGYRCEQRDPKLLADAIERLIHDKALYEQMKQNALRYSQKYDWSVIADSYHELYSKVVA